MWAACALARNSFVEQSQNVYVASAAVASLWYGAFFLGNLHRSFIIFGVPASAGLIAQAFTNKYKSEQGLPKDSFQTLRRKETVFCLLLVTAFVTSRAFSNRQGFVIREATVVGEVEKEAGVKL
jgi:hypothetical protein